MLLQRVGNGADSMSAREALEIATLGGAEVLGRGAELGSIEPGKRGDLAVWDVGGLGAAGAWDPVAALVLCGPFQVRDLVVEGRRVVREGRLAGVEVEAVVERANRRVARLMG
jgi:cytosine/adenosine deaminase-related metal-dependent hydrolase